MASRSGPEGAPATEDRKRRGSFSGVAGARVAWYLSTYWGTMLSMALNIKDPETERLAVEVAALTGTTKTGAVRYALRQVLESLSRPTVRQREERLTRFLEEEIWPLFPPDQLGKPLSKADREQILGFGEDGA
jgi:antitoxin VapB